MQFSESHPFVGVSTKLENRAKRDFMPATCVRLRKRDSHASFYVTTSREMHIDASCIDFEGNKYKISIGRLQ